jgi:hypothetical protein
MILSSSPSSPYPSLEQKRKKIIQSNNYLLLNSIQVIFKEKLSKLDTMGHCSGLEF